MRRCCIVYSKREVLKVHKQKRSERDFIDIDLLDYILNRTLRSFKTKPESFEEIIRDFRKLDTLPRRREDQKALFNSIMIVLESSIDINNELLRTVEDFVSEAKDAKTYIRYRLDKHREERKILKEGIKKLKKKLKEVMVHVGLKTEDKKKEKKKTKEGPEKVKDEIEGVKSEK